MVDKRLGTPEKFWAKVRKTRTCWLWVGWMNKGYGLVHRNGKDHLVHRYSWRLAYGPIPKGKYVCHHCDVKNCVRPIHLFLGTQTDNMRDMWRKGRGHDVRGSKTGTAKLHERDIPVIKALRANKITFPAIAKRFNVSVGAIETVMYGKAWRHVR